MKHSIRLTLTLWYVGILTAILGLFGLMLYMSVRASYLRDVDKAHVLQAEGVANALHAFWRAGQEANEFSPGNWVGAPSASLAEEAAVGRFPDLVDRWERTTQMFAPLRFMRLVDRNGRVLAASSQPIPLPEEVMQQSLRETRRGRAVFQTFRLPEGRLRFVTWPDTEDGRTVYFIQSAEWLRDMDASLGRLRVGLLLLIPSMLVVTSAIGWFLASQAMRPVADMIAQAHRISAQQLDKRMNVPTTGDEMEQLAKTFNSLLSRLENAFKQLRQFSAAASHELRTPLTAMKGELEVALRKPREVSAYREVLRTHLETIDDMTRTVEELLALARAEAAPSALEWRDVDLVGVAERAVEMWRPLAKRKSVELELERNGPVLVRGEERLLERIAANLLDNAVRHTPSRGRVTVSVERQAREACLTVQDTGPGIPADQLAQIFERFFKPRSTPEDHPSTGIGLGLCRWIAEVHRGRIDATSPAGHGATLTVRLPLSPAVR